MIALGSKRKPMRFFVWGIWANDYYIAIWLHNLDNIQHPGGQLQYENGKMVQNNHNHNSIQCT